MNKEKADPREMRKKKYISPSLGKYDPKLTPTRKDQIYSRDQGAEEQDRGK